MMERCSSLGRAMRCDGGGIIVGFSGVSAVVGIGTWLRERREWAVTGRLSMFKIPRMQCWSST